MATIRTAIALYDGVTAPLKSMCRAMNIVINSFESVQRVSGRAVDTRALQEAREELARAGSALDSIEQNIRGANNQQQRFNGSLRRGTSAANGLWSMVKRLVLAVGGLAAIKNIVNLSDRLAGSQARLSLIVDDGGSVAALEQKIMASAQRSRASYLDTANSVAKLSLLSGKAFKDNDETIRFAELMNKNFVIAGASASEQSNAMYQLNQAMAAGKLQGDEYRSITENAPLLKQAIEDYMTNVVKAKGSMKDWAREGLLTADVIKNALFASAEEVEARFAKMPKTWGQIWTIMKNEALFAFKPMLQRINEIANSERFQRFCDNVVRALRAIGEAAAEVFSGMIDAVNWAADNWSELAPVIWGVVAAIAAVKTAVLLLQAALLPSPIFWIAAAIGFVIMQIARWVQAVGGIRMAWLLLKHTVLTALENIELRQLQTAVAIANGWDFVKNALYGVVLTVQNLFDSMKAAVLLCVQDMINQIIDMINTFLPAWNAVFGTSVEAADHVTFGTEAQQAAQREDGMRAARLMGANYAAKQKQKEREKLLAAVQKQANINQRGREWEMAVLHVQNTALLTDPYGDYSAFSGALDGIAGGVGDTAGNTGRMADALDIAEEDLQYLRDIAEREAINRFTTAEIRLDMTNYNTVTGTQDIDGIVETLGEKLHELMVVSAEGRHV